MLGGNRRGGVAQLGVLIWSKAQFDDCTRVGDEFGLPAVVALKFLHSCLRLGVPVTGGFAGEITGSDQRCLNLGGSVVVDHVLFGWL